MIDIHSHILFGVDDGPSSLEEALELARYDQLLGIKKIIATPHYIPGVYEITYEEVKEKVDQFNQALRQYHIPIQVYAGQEVRITSQIAEQLSDKKIGTLNGKKYMLIELSPDGVSEEELEGLEKLKEQKIVPLIAHIERYTLKKENRRMLEVLEKSGCYFQMNSDDLMGENGYRMKQWSKKLIEMNKIIVLASDAHSAVVRNPGLSVAYERLTSSKMISVMKKNAKHILEGEDIVPISSIK